METKITIVPIEKETHYVIKEDEFEGLKEDNLKLDFPALSVTLFFICLNSIRSAYFQIEASQIYFDIAIGSAALVASIFTAYLWWNKKNKSRTAKILNKIDKRKESYLESLKNEKIASKNKIKRSLRRNNNQMQAIDNESVI